MNTVQKNIRLVFSSLPLANQKFIKSNLKVIRYIFNIPKRIVIMVLNFFSFIIIKITEFFLWIFNYTIPNFHLRNYAIGHLIIEPDCYVKEQILGLIPNKKTIMLASKVANKHILTYWKKYFVIITSKRWCKFLSQLSDSKLIGFSANKYTATPITESGLWYQIEEKWNNRKPLFQLRPEDEKRGKETLELMGVPKDQWFVCVHARDSGYWEKYGDPNLMDNPNVFRNSPIESYDLAVEHIVSLGGICIRMGDSTMTPNPPIPGLIDYAHSEYCSDWMDVFLCASCRFYLGSNSGAYNLASAFGVPVACANEVPLSAIYPGACIDIGIAKLYQNTISKGLVRFDTIMSAPNPNLRLADEYEQAGIELVNNSREEILELTIEMYQRVMGTYVSQPEDEVLQSKFRSLFKPGHQSYGSSSLVGASFLRKYKNLLI